MDASARTLSAEPRWALGPPRDLERLKARTLIERWGWNATSFQTLSAGFSYWFCESACVAYVDLPKAWVGAGAPIAAPSELGNVSRRFAAAANRVGKRASFFAVERRFVEATQVPALALGEQPIFDPAEWHERSTRSASLRAQLRRARSKGVCVEQSPSERAARELERLHRVWLAERPLAKLGFLTGHDPFFAADERRYYVAKKGGAPLAFAALSPIYAREGWLFEHLVRAPSAPNGSVELLVDFAMRELDREGARYATLGLAPLAGDVALPLRLVRRAARPLFNFEGLRAFKAKFCPRRWEPVYLAHPHSGAWSALEDALVAFAGGEPLRFAQETLRRQWALRAPLVTGA